MTGLLASVRDPHEAQLALAGGADIIDCKNPQQGALGALPPDRIQRIVATVGRQRPVSATVGDIADPALLGDALQAVHASGVDYIKFGLFDTAGADDCLQAVAAHPNKQRSIAVCFADRFDPLPLLPRIAALELGGVMIDTADKRAGRLTELWSAVQLEHLVKQAHDLGLLCGLAGRLTQQDIVQLLPHGADYLGFRSALCDGDRGGDLSATSMQQVRLSIPGESHVVARAAG
jgi:dihydroneopterin aldolase